MNEAINPKTLLLHGEAERSVGRQLTSRESIRRIANTFLVRLGVPFLILSALAIGVFVFKLESTEKTTIWWFIVAMTGLIALIIVGHIAIAEFRALSKGIRQELHASSADTKDEIGRILAKSLDPQVTILRSKSEVRSEAAKLIEGAIQTLTDVHYFGAANLTPSDQEFREASHSEDRELSDIVRYQNALTDAKNCDVKVERFVWLFDEPRFALREATTRSAYLAWLQHQVSHLKTNPNYMLYDSRRAPEWGGSTSTILTSSGMLEIIGSGRAGLLVISSRIPEVFLSESRKNFWAAQRIENKPKLYTIVDVGKLHEMLKILSTLHQELLATDGKSTRSGTRGKKRK